MTPGRKWAIWVGAAFALTAIVFAGLIGLVILANGALAEHVRGGPGVPAVIAFAALAASVGLGVLALVVWSRLLRPGAALAAETKFVAETGRDGAIDPARFPWLAALAAAVNALAGRHAAARHLDRRSPPRRRCSGAARSRRRAAPRSSGRARRSGHSRSPAPANAEG